MKEYVLTVPGMSCKHCEMKTSEALKHIGLKGFTVDLNSKTIRLKTEDVERVKKVLVEIEYPVSAVEEVC